MTYYKFTTISGTKLGQHKCYTPNGHWNPERASAYGRRLGMVGIIEVTHHVADMSGHGRSGHDGRYKVDENGTVTQQAAWSEFGQEHIS